MNQLRLAMNAGITVQLPEPTATTAYMIANLGDTIGNRTPNGWALLEENIGDGYQQAVGNWLKLSHAPRSRVLGCCNEAKKDGKSFIHTFALSRAALNDAEIPLEQLPQMYSVSVEWLYNREKSYAEHNGERLTISEAINKGLLEEADNQIKVTDEGTTLYPCDVVFADTALVDLRYSRPNYRSAEILAASNTRGVNEVSFEEVGAPLMSALVKKIGGNLLIYRTYKDRALVEKYEPEQPYRGQMYWVQYSAKRDEDGLVTVTIPEDGVTEYKAENADGQPTADNEQSYKTEAGKKFSRKAYAYIGDPKKPSTWKIRLEESPGKVTVAQLGRAAAAFSSGGFRGKKVEMPSSAVGMCKAKIRSAYRRLGVKQADMPESVRNAKAEEVKNDMEWPEQLSNLSDEQKEAVKALMEEAVGIGKNEAVEAYKAGEGAKAIETARKESRDHEALVHNRLAELAEIHPIADEERQELLNVLRAADDKDWENLKLRRQVLNKDQTIEQLKAAKDDKPEESKPEATGANTADPEGPGIGADEDKPEDKDKELRFL